MHSQGLRRPSVGVPSTLLALLFLAACGGQVGVEGTTPAPDDGQDVASGDAEAGPQRPEPAPVVIERRGPALEITSAGVAIDGHLLPGQPTYDQFVERLGPPTRSESLANVVHVYEDLGIVMLQPHGRPEIIEVSIYFARMEISFMPQNTFGGSVTLNGQALHGGHNVADIPRIFPGLTFDDEYLLSTVVNPSVEVFFRERPDGEKLGRISIDFPH